jgi:hypothetical protein
VPKVYCRNEIVLIVINPKQLISLPHIKQKKQASRRQNEKQKVEQKSGKSEK